MTTAAEWVFFNPTLWWENENYKKATVLSKIKWLSKIKSFSERLAGLSWDKFYMQLPSQTELVLVWVSYPADHYWRPCRSQLSVITNAHVSEGSVLLPFPHVSQLYLALSTLIRFALPLDFLIFLIWRGAAKTKTELMPQLPAPSSNIHSSASICFIKLLHYQVNQIW